MRNAYIINTNLTHNQNCEQQMLQQEKCAAYYSPWKHYISLIRPNDLVFYTAMEKELSQEVLLQV